MVYRGLRGGQVRFLSRKQVTEIHAATLEVLEKVGLRTASKQILEVFEKGGAQVDRKDGSIRIPQHMVKESIEKAPSQIVLCGRSPKYDILLEGNRVYYGMGGTPTPFIRDIETGESRRRRRRISLSRLDSVTRCRTCPS